MGERREKRVKERAALLSSLGEEVMVTFDTFEVAVEDIQFEAQLPEIETESGRRVE